MVALAPWCRGPLTDYSVLACNCDLIETLMLAVLPPASFATDISGVVGPFQRRSFYATKRFEEVMLNKDRIIKQPLNIDLAAMEQQMGLMAYHLVLHRVYGAELPPLGTIVFTVPDYQVGLYRHYSVNFNSDFVTVKVVGSASSSRLFSMPGSGSGARPYWSRRAVTSRLRASGV